MPTNQPRRKPVPPEVERRVLAESRRRCAICFFYDNDSGQKRGQIAHLDRMRSNSTEDNLAFLCLNHHSEYDSATSQHKNYTMAEVKAARNSLYQWAKRIEPSAPETSQSAPPDIPEYRDRSEQCRTVVRLEFKHSPLLTLSRRTRIQQDLDRLIEYCQRPHISVPQEIGRAHV